MNLNKKLILGFGAAFTLLGSTDLGGAQSWTTVYDLPNALCGDVGQNAAGFVFAAGRQTAPDGSSTAIVQASGDQGASWVLLDQYSEAGLSYSHNRAFTADPVNGNHLFAGGNLNNLLPNGTYQYDTLWFIRERDPVTAVWSTVDDYTRLANDVGQASCADILVTPSGDLYATGGSALGAGPGWLIRKRPAGASTFTTVDADYSRQTAGAGWDQAFHPTYGVFVVGDLNGRWTVRRSPNGDRGTWTTVDSFYVSRQWTSGSAKFILATPSLIHVAGSAYNASTRKTHWVIRSSVDGGATWSMTDNLAPAGASAEARGIVEDAAGNLVVCGFVVGTAGDMHWVVRKGTPATKLVKQGGVWVQVAYIAWTTSDDFQLASGKTAQPNAMTTDLHGNIFVGGAALDASGNPNWIVRKLAAQ